jgi:aryl-phospho-beta-D-glucosidase BglC (GH1 family)
VIHSQVSPHQSSGARARIFGFLASSLAVIACGGGDGLDRDEAERGVGIGGQSDPSTTRPPPPQATGPVSEGARLAPGGYYVVGNTIYDIENQPHVFRGMNRPSLEWGSAGEGMSPNDFQAMAEWGANVVRIPLNQQFWLENRNSYRDHVEASVDWSIAAGLDVILDLHWSHAGLEDATDQHVMADQLSVEFWRQVAEAYKNDGRVLFELYNEPHDITWSQWLSGGTVLDLHHSGNTFEAAGMQAMYDAVRATGAHNLVIATGLDWGYLLRDSPELDGYNVAYASHLYDFGHKQPQFWQTDWAGLGATRALFVTEFGSTHGGDPCDASYDQSLVEFAANNAISWTAWAWFPGGCMFPSLLEDWSLEPTPAGRVIRAALLDN